MSKLTPPRGYNEADTEKRVQWLLERTGFCPNGAETADPQTLKGIIENHIGFMSIPMSVAGPLLIRGRYAEGEYYVPLCTLEGTLTMSMTRGLLLTYYAGGIQTQHIKQELSRSPIFIFGDIAETTVFQGWINEHFAGIKAAAEKTTRFGKLIKVDCYVTQNSMILDFVYNTLDAAGQNMVTLATDAACRFIRDTYQSRSGFQYFIECNFNCDKNPAYKTVLQGRGHYVVASACIPGKLVRRVLRTTAAEFAEAWKRCSNALAALYLATGQDVAGVAENAVGIVEFEDRDGDLQTTLTMPSISVGTVGGGTRLQQAKNNLGMLGCTGPDSSKKLAEITCACALALEISLGGAIVTDEFAGAHAQFGRE
jgi:hydroxymethylglutaryl-CoA reductase (NADPH)